MARAPRSGGSISDGRISGSPPGPCASRDRSGSIRSTTSWTSEHPLTRALPSAHEPPVKRAFVGAMAATVLFVGCSGARPSPPRSGALPKDLPALRDAIAQRMLDDDPSWARYLGFHA